MPEMTSVVEAGNAERVFADIRAQEFPWTSQQVYLNNASIGPLPERTSRVVHATTAKRQQPFEFSDGELLNILTRARSVAARLINAHPGEIALATNTSYGINLAAQALPVRAGETVLISDREFPANVYPWLVLRERGIKVELARPTPEGWPDEDCLLERLRDPSVRLLAMSFVQFSNGYRADLDTLGHACRANGTFFVVDAIQGLGHVPLDVTTTPIDILSSGGQKWLLSPWGSGFVYVRRELLDTLAHVVGGWMAFEGTDDFTRLTEYRYEFRPDARRFELPTLPYQDLAGFCESVNLVVSLGVDRIAAHTRRLREPLLAAADAGTLRISSPADAAHATSIVCIVPRNLDRGFAALKRAGVTCVLREGSIRLSPHFYNTVAEIERVIDVLSGA